MQQQLVARVSKSKTLLLMLVAAGFVVTGVWLIGNADEIAATTQRAFLRSPTVSRAVGWLVVLCFGVGGVVIARQLFRSEPVMEIDSRGILWRRWSDQVVPWSAIVRAEPRAVYNQNFLCLWLDAPERYPARSTLGKLSGMNKAMGFGDLSLSMQGTDQSFDRLLEVVGTHLAARDRLAGAGSGQP